MVKICSPVKQFVVVHVSVALESFLSKTLITNVIVLQQQFVASFTAEVSVGQFPVPDHAGIIISKWINRSC